jgi:hypothetical protein
MLPSPGSATHSEIRALRRSFEGVIVFAHPEAPVDAGYIHCRRCRLREQSTQPTRLCPRGP